MSKLTKYIKPYRWFFVLTLLLLLAESMASLLLPSLMANIVDNGIMRGVAEDTPQTAYILQMGFFMLMVALLSGLAAVGAGYLAPRISAGAARDLRRDLFIKVESFSQKEFDSFSSASLITRCTNDVTQVQNLANIAARMLFFAPIMGAGGIIMAVSRAVSMAWIIALAVIVLIGFVATIVPIVMPRFRIIQGMIDKLNKISRETLHGLMVIRAFGTQEHEKNRFDQSNKEIAETTLFVSRVMAVAAPAMTLILGGTQMLVVWIGAHQIAQAGLQIGDMIAFMQYSMAVIFAFMMISMIMVQIPRAAVSAGRIVEVLATEPVITDPDSPASFDNNKQGIVTFQNVCFRYPGAEVDAISDINFTAMPGQTTAIIGPTGSGKSTIAQLLLRFYDISAGSITVNGTDIRQVNQTDLREKIGYVPQKGQLISGTITSNIRYGRPDATDEEVAQVAEVAQALSFIEEKPEGFDAEIGQKGGNVSGGQRQRLSIARALAKKPEILVFDDSFSALDFQTDAKLRKALREHAADTTVIVIAQRVGTIRNAEQILVLDEGRVTGCGTHEELLENCPAYYEIASSQGAVE